MKFSLILPTYNVEQYLPKCIESCLNQDLDYEQYEIIVVIDGSPDNSKEIALRYAEEYKNIHVVEQVNGGLSDARNTGLLHAKGEYIWFIDPDDFIEANVLESIYNNLTGEKLECLWIQWEEISESGRSIPPFTDHITHTIYETMNGLEFMKKVLSNHLYAWSFIYKREYLLEHNLKFKKGMYYEDTDFALRSLPYIKRIKLHQKVCYSYLHRNSSITHSINKKKITDILANISRAYELKINSESDKELRLFYTKSYSCFLIFILKEIAKINDNILYSKIENHLISNNIREVFIHGNLINRIICLSFNLLGVKHTFNITKCMLILEKKIGKRNK